LHGRLKIRRLCSGNEKKTHPEKPFGWIEELTNFIQSNKTSNKTFAWQPKHGLNNRILKMNERKFRHYAQ
jgi:hypothetical protein